MRTRLQFALAALGVAALASSASAQGAQVGGQLEANYSYNFNKPSTRTNTYLFNTTDGAFTVNVGEVNVKRAVSDKEAGYTLRLITGRIQEYFAATYGTGNILEAYGSTKRDLGGKELTVDFGQFLSHVGLETPDVGSGQFFSKSFNYQYLQPFVHSGIRASFSLGDNTTFMGVLVNRFDGVKDPDNRDLGVGFQFARQMGNSSVSLNVLSARENVGTSAAVANRSTSVANIVYNNKLSESTSLAVDATLRAGKDISNRTYNVSGFTGYLTKTLGNENVIAVRAEYLSQDNATSAILPLYVTDPTRKPTLTSITGSYELKGAFPGARTLVEFRMDRAGGAIFPGDKATSIKKDQTSLTLAQVFKF